MHIRFIQQFWLKKYNKQKYTCIDWLLIFILRPISFLYACGFLVILRIKKLQGHVQIDCFRSSFDEAQDRLRFVSPQGERSGIFSELSQRNSSAHPEEAKGRLEGRAAGMVAPKIISIGNLSVGGTGKTVMVEFLFEHLLPLKGGVVLRGYKRSTQTKEPILVCDGKKLFTEVAECGDEAYMLAVQNKVPIAVGKKRGAACDLLLQKAHVDYILLDDAYQNICMHRDLNILLIDARYPLSQTTWFPAGFLREKDFTRADVIVLTHAQDLLQQEVAAWYDELSNFNPKNIFFGEHACAGIFLNNSGDDVTKYLKDKKVVAMAGIGNILSFVEKINEQNIDVASMIDFGDHYTYVLQDMREVIEQCNKLAIGAVVMTSKDWYKCEGFIKALQTEIITISFYVLRVQFEFLSEQQYDRFSDCIWSKLPEKKEEMN